MITFIVGMLAGAFIGWNLPQPQWAKKAQQVVKDYFK